MKKYIVLLRGINVGGHRKIAMKDLKILLEEKGFKDCKTYIQSGNIILNSTENKENIKYEIQNSIQEKYDFEVKTFVFEIDEWNKLISENTDEIENGSKYFVAFLNKLPSKTSLESLENIEFKDETWKIQKTQIYFETPSGIGKSKLNNNFIEQKLKVEATTRNWKTILKLQELSVN
ncbi:DUF1697 domain-containing protein [Aureivirga marina]|uniref:DUF1697 domain-containing protein n=1 Tax=Aureivirga marina TaxID=1182451 RepID=UPI0018C9E2F1|nr:DUF1697 domain-containing protein [Aureivirga marina]